MITLREATTAEIAAVLLDRITPEAYRENKDVMIKIAMAILEENRIEREGYGY